MRVRERNRDRFGGARELHERRPPTPPLVEGALIAPTVVAILEPTLAAGVVYPPTSIATP